MKVQELLDILGEEHPDAEVRFASQPNWPFEYSISDAVLIDVDENGEDLDKPVIYLVEGRQIGYLPQQVKDEIGW